MKKTLLTERFQELAGIKPLAEQPKFPYGQDLGSMQANPDRYTDVNPYATDKDDKKIFTPVLRLNLVLPAFTVVASLSTSFLIIFLTSFQFILFK